MPSAKQNGEGPAERHIGLCACAMTADLLDGSRGKDLCPLNSATTHTPKLELANRRGWKKANKTSERDLPECNQSSYTAFEAFNANQIFC